MSAKVVQLKTRLSSATKADVRDNATIISILKELKTVPMTLDVLKSTKIGIVVNRLKKDSNSEISILSKMMVKSWRNLVKLPPASSKSSSPTKTSSSSVALAKNGKETKQQTTLPEVNPRDGKAFLENNGKAEGVVVLPSGLQYKVLSHGPVGRSPGPNTICECNYRGTLIDGTEFDSSYKRGCSVSFPLNKVIKGWTQAMQLMKEGDKWQVFIPPQLAYKNKCKGKHIKPGEVLIFELELLRLKGEAVSKKKTKEGKKGKQTEVRKETPTKETPAGCPPEKKRKVEEILNVMKAKYQLGSHQDNMRNKVQKLIHDALGPYPTKEQLFKDMDAAERDKIEIKRKAKVDVAYRIEEAMSKKFDGPSQGYKSFYRSLKFNLKDPKNTGLNWGLLAGSISAKKLVGMSEEDMASGEMQKLRDENAKWMLAAARCDWERDHATGNTDIFRCEECGKRNCKYFQQQTRGADEPMTVFVTCMECGHKWRDGDNDGD